jgi:hypothetical protein
MLRERSNGPLQVSFRADISTLFSCLSWYSFLAVVVLSPTTIAWCCLRVGQLFICGCAAVAGDTPVMVRKVPLFRLNISIQHRCVAHLYGSNSTAGCNPGIVQHLTLTLEDLKDRASNKNYPAQLFAFMLFNSISVFINSFVPFGSVIARRTLVASSSIESLKVKNPQQALSALIKATKSSSILSEPLKKY